MKTAIIAILSGLFIGIAIAFTGSTDGDELRPQTAQNATVVDGKQIIEITAKGGYSPRLIAAKADLPTVLKIRTKGTFDCSAALTIPKLKYAAHLPPSGVQEVEVPPQKAGAKLEGICAMGMYNFVVNFQ